MTEIGEYIIEHNHVFWMVLLKHARTFAWVKPPLINMDDWVHLMGMYVIIDHALNYVLV